MKKLFQSLVMCASVTLVSSPVAFAFGSAPADGGAAPVVYTPVVLAPGLMIPVQAYDLQSIKDIFHQNGYELYTAQMPSAGSVESRADKLNSEIQRLVPTGKFHMLAISLGGLDARRAIQKYDLGSRVISLTTLSTPHRGTPLADAILKLKTGQVPSSDQDSSMLSMFKDLDDSLRDLTTGACAVFNQNVKDDPRVLYFSYGFMIPEPVTSYGVSPLTWYLHKQIKDASGEDNDSLVGTGSANWGTYLGTMESDHLSISIPLLFNGHFVYTTTYQTALAHLKQVDGR